jgi:inner membrane protein
MAEFYDLFMHLNAWHWLILAAALLVLELVTGGTTYLLWPSASAFILSIIHFIVPMHWQVEWSLFALLTLVLTVVGSTWLRPLLSKGGQHDLNERAERLVGQSAEIAHDFTNGAGRVRLGDTQWQAVSMDGKNLKAGHKVVVKAVEGVTLTVMTA